MFRYFPPPVTESGPVYLDYACFGPACPETTIAVQQLVQRLEQVPERATQFTTELFQVVDSARQTAARFLNVAESQVGLVESTTQGLGWIASSLDLDPGAEILVADVEFMAAALVWQSQRAESSGRVLMVPTRGVTIRPEDFDACVTPRTRVVVLSSVQEVTGYRINVEEFGEWARSRGLWLIIDGIQEAGAFPPQVEGADAYLAGGHKWLCSPFGYGFCYVSERLQERLEPPYLGYLNLSEPRDGWESYLQSPDRTPVDVHRPHSAVRVHESGGTPNWLAATGLKNALEVLESIGRQRISRRILELVKRLREGLLEQGIGVLGSEEESDRKVTQTSGVFSFNLPGKIEAERCLKSFLADRRISVSLRYTSGRGGIRVSPHYFTDESDIDRFLQAVEDFRSEF